MSDPKSLTGILFAAAGLLFFLAGLVRRLDEPLWLILGVVFVLLGVVVLRSRAGSE